MVFTAWFLLVFFGVFTFRTTIQYYIGKRTLGWVHLLAWFFSAVITGISSGVIWGGLFQ